MATNRRLHALKLSWWRGKYPRVLELRDSTISTVDPLSDRATNSFHLEEVIDARIVHGSDGEFQLVVPRLCSLSASTMNFRASNSPAALEFVCALREAAGFSSVLPTSRTRYLEPRRKLQSPVPAPSEPPPSPPPRRRVDPAPIEHAKSPAPPPAPPPAPLVRSSSALDRAAAWPEVAARFGYMPRVEVPSLGPKAASSDKENTGEIPHTTEACVNKLKADRERDAALLSQVAQSHRRHSFDGRKPAPISPGGGGGEAR